MIIPRCGAFGTFSVVSLGSHSLSHDRQNFHAEEFGHLPELLQEGRIFRFGRTLNGVKGLDGLR